MSRKPTGTGPRVVYVGNQGGLKPAREILREDHVSGDPGSPNDYAIICGCGAELGMLATFRPNAEGSRSPWCPLCERATFVDKNGQIVGHAPVTRDIVGHQLKITASRS
jgi:hypothetical protein